MGIAMGIAIAIAIGITSSSGLAIPQLTTDRRNPIIKGIGNWPTLDISRGGGLSFIIWPVV